MKRWGGKPACTAGENPEDIKRQALETYLRALMRFAGFTLSGTVPEDLLPPN
jgi:hypothetical protein